MQFSSALSLLLLVAAAAATASVAMVTPYRKNCAEFTSCRMCAAHLSWLGTSCRWCPIDRGCHEAGSVKNRCAEGHFVIDPARCTPDKIKKFEFNRQLSHYAATISGAAYSPAPAECMRNYQRNDPITDVEQVTVKCDSFTNDCSGFVGRSSNRKLLLLSMRGTHGSTQLLLEGLLSLASPKQPSRVGGRVQRYFNDAFQKLWPLLLPKLQQLIARHPDHRLLVTGHSLGGALAALAAVELAASHAVPEESLLFYSFGEPRVGDYDFAAAFDSFVPNAWRVVHANDLVVHLPMCSPVMMLNSAEESHELHKASLRSVQPYSCSSHFGMPYHHGSEIFFPRGVKMAKESEQYRKCNGIPLNEDLNCANASENWNSCFNPAHSSECLHSHLNYYSIHLGKWWDINRCAGDTELQ